MAKRQLLEQLEFFRQVPGESAPVADDPLAGHGRNDY
jgi:hypothetical protein